MSKLTQYNGSGVMTKEKNLLFVYPTPTMSKTVKRD